MRARRQLDLFEQTSRTLARVAVARALIHRPQLLLADEPTGNLDSRNGRHVFDLMVGLNRRHGTTLVLVTHDAELAARADRRISLRDGRVVSDENLRGAAGDDPTAEELEEAEALNQNVRAKGARP